MKGFYKLLRRRDLFLGGMVTGLFVLVALLAPWLAPREEIPTSQQDNTASANFRLVDDSNNLIPQPPNSKVLLGTTQGQIDVYYSLVWGTRGALLFGILVAAGAAILGTLTGAVGALAGDWANWMLMRITDAFLAIPLIAGIVLANELRRIYFSQTPQGMPLLFTRFWDIAGLPPVVEFWLSPHMVFILLIWMPYARLVNGMALRLKSSEFILAARMIGASPWRIILRHLIPNLIAPVIVLISRDIGAVVLLDAGLAFIGITNESVWGKLLAYGRDWVMGHGGDPLRYWWVFIPPSVVIILFGIGWSLLGDAINEWLNPRRQSFG